MAEKFPDQLTILTKKVPGWQEFDARHSKDSFRIVRRFKPLPNWQVQHLPKILFSPVMDLWPPVATRVDIIHPGDSLSSGRDCAMDEGLVWDSLHRILPRKKK